MISSGDCLVDHQRVGARSSIARWRQSSPARRLVAIPCSALKCGGNCAAVSRHRRSICGSSFPRFHQGTEGRCKVAPGLRLQRELANNKNNCTGRPTALPFIARGRIIICHWVVSDKQERGVEPVARIRGTGPPGIVERITRIEMIGLAVNRTAWVLQERQNTSLSQTQSISDSHQDSRLGKLMVLHPRQNDQYTPCSKEKYIYNFNVEDAEVNILAVPPKKIQRLKGENSRWICSVSLSATLWSGQVGGWVDLIRAEGT